MKIFKTYMLMASLAASAVIVGCTSDVDMPDTAGNGDTMLKVSAEIVPGSRSIDYRTSFTNNDRIGMLVYTGQEGALKQVDRITASYSGGKWVLSRQFDLSDYPDGLYVSAYYPADIEPQPTANGSLLFTALDVRGNTDLLGSKLAHASLTSSTASLQFSHVLSSITLNISRGDNLSGTKLNDVVVSGLQTKVSEKSPLLFDNGKSSLTKSAEEDCYEPYITYYNSKFTKTITINLLTLPQSATKATATITIDDKSYRFYLLVNDMLNSVQTPYNIVVDDVITTTPDEIYFGDYKGVYLGINYGGKPLYWADRNVGASTSWEYGDYYAWGSIKDGGTFTEAGFDGSTSTGSISGTDKDVASVKMGLGWRMPMASELEQLTYLEKKNVEIEGVQGWMFTGTNGKQIFMPNAGCYYGDRCFSKGDAGYYWSATATSATTADVLNNGWISVFMQTGWNKVQGCSVRGVISL